MSRIPVYIKVPTAAKPGREFLITRTTERKITKLLSLENVI